MGQIFQDSFINMHLLCPSSPPSQFLAMKQPWGRGQWYGFIYFCLVSSGLLSQLSKLMDELSLKSVANERSKNKTCPKLPGEVSAEQEMEVRRPCCSP